MNLNESEKTYEINDKNTNSSVPVPDHVSAEAFLQTSHTRSHTRSPVWGLRFPEWSWSHWDPSSECLTPQWCASSAGRSLPVAGKTPPPNTSDPTERRQRITAQISSVIKHYPLHGNRLKFITDELISSWRKAVPANITAGVYIIIDLTFTAQWILYCACETLIATRQ